MRFTSTLCFAICMTTPLACDDSPAVDQTGSDGTVIDNDAQGDASVDAPNTLEDQRDDHTVSDSTDDSDTALGVELTVSASAVETCGSWEPEHQPGLSYETPDHIRAGVIAVELLESHRALNPQPLQLDEAVVEVDLSGGGELSSTDLGALREGTFSHIRVELAYSLFSVDATAHQGMDVAGTLEFDTALTAYETAEGVSRNQGQIDATFYAYGAARQSLSFSIPMLNCVLSAWGGIAATTDARFRVTVPVPDGPIVIDHSNPQPIEIELDFPLRDTVAWRDLEGAGFAEGVLDVAIGSFETPDALFECNLLMNDRCQEDIILPIHPTWPMPDSNIDFCTDGYQELGSCPGEGADGYGQDASYMINLPDFDVGTEIVHDRLTGLDWQRVIAPESYDWWDAREHCFDLDLGGHADWRLPSRIEFVTIVDLDGGYPTIDLEVFPDNSSDFFWSASPVPFLNLAYGIRFEMGYIYDHDPYTASRVRCVRGAYAASEPRFDIEDETVSDAGTELMWQRGVFDDVMSWLDSLTACEALELAGHEDWRLPSLKELQTIVDERRVDPSIDFVAFPNTPIEGFWASTPVRIDPATAWSTSFTDGYSIIYATDELHQVRCVRQIGDDE